MSTARARNVRYGYRREGGQLVPDAAEQATMGLARAWLAAGASFRQTGARLAEAGRYPREGGAWHPPQIARMVDHLTAAPPPPA